MKKNILYLVLIFFVQVGARAQLRPLDMSGNGVFDIMGHKSTFLKKFKPIQDTARLNVIHKYLENKYAPEGFEHTCYGINLDSDDHEDLIVCSRSFDNKCLVDLYRQGTDSLEPVYIDGSIALSLEEKYDEWILVTGTRPCCSMEHHRVQA